MRNQSIAKEEHLYGKDWKSPVIKGQIGRYLKIIRKFHAEQDTHVK